MQNETKRQSGGILAFILIGIALVALLGGGIYLSKQQGRIASQADTVATDTPKPEDTTPNETKTEETPEGASQPQTADPKPSTPTPATPAPAAQTPDRSETASRGVPATGPSNIAASGPSDVIVPMLALSLLAGGAISYRRSLVTFRTASLK